MNSGSPKRWICSNQHEFDSTGNPRRCPVCQSALIQLARHRPGAQQPPASEANWAAPVYATLTVLLVTLNAVFAVVLVSKTRNLSAATAELAAVQNQGRALKMELDTIKK